MYKQIVLTLAVALGCNYSTTCSAKEFARVLPAPKMAERPLTVSILKLLTQGEKYENRRISVRGYMIDRPGCKALYPTAEFAHSGAYESAIWINLDPKVVKVWELGKVSAYHNMDKRYVVVTGRFTSMEHGSQGLFEGSLNEIDGIIMCPTYKEDELGVR